MLPFVQRVKFAGILGQIIIDIRQLFFADLVHQHLEDRILASQLFGVILLGEFYRDLRGLFLFHAYHAILKTRDKLARTDI